jgi:hypothetical protein
MRVSSYWRVMENAGSYLRKAMARGNESDRVIRQSCLRKAKEKKSGTVVRMSLHFPATQVDHPALIDLDESVVIVKSKHEEPQQKVLSSKGKVKEVCTSTEKLC